MERFKNKRILLVEDDVIIALDEAQVLKKRGLQVEIAGTGRDAVNRALSEPAVDLVLMDIDLGKGLSGPEAAKIILSKISVPIVFLTSHSEPEIVNMVKNITRYGYVLKQSGEFVLLSSIETAFELFESKKKLEESEERFRKLVECAPDGIYVQIDWKLAFVNKAVLDLYGAESEQELLGTPVMDRIHPEHHDLVAERIRTINSERLAVPRIKYKQLRMDGSPVLVEVSAEPIEYNGRQGALVFVRDIRD